MSRPISPVARAAARRSRRPARRARCSPTTPGRRRSWITPSGSRSTRRTDSGAPPWSSIWPTARTAGRSSAWWRPTDPVPPAGVGLLSRRTPGPQRGWRWLRSLRSLRRSCAPSAGSGPAFERARLLALAAVLVVASGLSVWLAMRARMSVPDARIAIVELLPADARTRGVAGDDAAAARIDRRLATTLLLVTDRAEAFDEVRVRLGDPAGRAAAMAGLRPHSGRRRRLRAPAAGRGAPARRGRHRARGTDRSRVGAHRALPGRRRSVGGRRSQRAAPASRPGRSGRTVPSGAGPRCGEPPCGRRVRPRPCRAGARAAPGAAPRRAAGRLRGRSRSAP